MRDVILATEWIRAVAAHYLDLKDPLQNEFHQHLSYVFNQIVNKIRTGGYTEQTGQEVGKMLWRLYFVYVEYKSKSKVLSQKEWLAALMAVAKQIGDTIGIKLPAIGVS